MVLGLESGCSGVGGLGVFRGQPANSFPNVPSPAFDPESAPTP